MMLPFAGGMTSTLNGTLVFSVAAAVLYLFMTHRPVSLARTAAKTAAVALLAVLAWLAGGSVLLVAVLAVSALGDYFLSLDGERNFLFGLGSFLLGHVGYVVLFLPIGREPALPLGMAGTAVMLAAEARRQASASTSSSIRLSLTGGQVDCTMNTSRPRTFS